MLSSITLKCANCGANLEVKAETQTFACGYCGASQMVERHGGTVSLHLLKESISKVQIGTDKTAAELAIRRIKEEMAEIDKIYKKRSFQLEQDKSNLAKSYVGFFVIMALIALLMTLAVSELLAAVVAFLIAGGMFYLWSKTNASLEQKNSPQITSLKNQYKSLQTNLAKQKEIVNG